MCWPSRRARKIWTSSRASGLKALADRFGASCLRVTMRSSVRIASVGLSTSARAAKIPTVDSQGDLSVTEQVSHSLSHVDPSHDFLSFACHLLANGKSLRFVDHHFQSEDRTGLVVHLEPVLFHSMFDPGSGDPFEGEIADVTNDFAFEVGPDLSPEKAHDFVGAKAQCAVTQ
jgi:hypothetical protein